MKKIIFLMASLMVSGTAWSAISLSGGNNDFRMADCNLLANDTEVTLTSNVVGGIQCDEGNNYIALSTCHSNGLVSERSAVVTEDNDGTTICTVTPDEDCVEVVSGSAFPTASTDKGTVSSLFPEQTCSAGNVESHVDGLSPEE